MNIARISILVISIYILNETMDYEIGCIDNIIRNLNESLYQAEICHPALSDPYAQIMKVIKIDSIKIGPHPVYKNNTKT